MATPYQPVSPPPLRRQSLGTRVNRFWQRVTDGLELEQLWHQFRIEARTSYSLYSREIDSTPKEGVRRGRRWLDIARQFFWAILEKLSPARRVLLLLALVLLMFVLLILEIADRVVMKRDLQIAREIQMWLLPVAAPQVPGIEIAFATRPANTVAGDYYDVFPRPAHTSSDQSFLVAVADVAGKSIPAALLMATFQASLKTLSATPSSLVELVNGMNKYACGNSQGGLRFVTAFLAEYEPAARTMTYINAGHNQPMLRNKSGAIQHLDAGGLPLGIKADAAYQTGTVTLEAGDWLVVFTDGVVEAINEAGADYGEQRLISVLNAGTDVPPVKMLSRIMVDLDSFVGNTPQHDDITCLLIKGV